MKESYDRHLYDKIVRQERHALELLYDRYEKILFSFAYQLTQDDDLAEQVVHEVLFKLWDKRVQYESFKGKFSVWLLTVARYTAIEILQRQKRQLHLSLLDEREMAIIYGMDDDFDAVERSIEIHNAISQLSFEHKWLIDLLYFKGMSKREISEETFLPLEVVTGRVQLAVQRLKKILTQERERKA